MMVSKDRVYLVQGRVSAVSGEEGDGLALRQVVVVAENSEAAIELLRKKMPGFSVAGFATLKEYESTAAKIRGVVGGKDTSWPLIVEGGVE